MITRYQFELLAFLEKHGADEYPIRTLSDALAISGSELSSCIDILHQEGMLEQRGKVLEITEKGLDALEPFRVKRAIILAAGFGSRMVPVTLDRPKPLVAVNGVRIIDTLLDALCAVGITDITIVRGYKKECFDELYAKYNGINLIDNDVYSETNNISSVMLALGKLDNCYLCEADLYISNPDIITKYQYHSNILGSYSLETDDWCFDMHDGSIVNYRKGGTFCYNYYGISYWTADDCASLREDFRDVYENEEGGRDYFWEFIPLVLRREHYNVEIRQCSKSDIIEIDNFYELVQLDPSYAEYKNKSLEG